MDVNVLDFRLIAFLYEDFVACDDSEDTSDGKEPSETLVRNGHEANSAVLPSPT
jgi:hypothetical protein